MTIYDLGIVILQILMVIICAGGICLLVSLIYLALFGEKQAVRELNESIDKLAAFKCPSCGKCFGQEAAENAQKEHAIGCQKIRKQYPDWRINFDTEWHIKCSSCQQISDFDYKHKQLNENPRSRHR